MINAAMYFALGFLAAGLLALVFGPAVWRRAVRLTRRSLEATSPMSLAEARAARDQLRAEYAVKTRRLELGAEGLKERMVRQELEVSQSREAMKAAVLERDETSRALREMEVREAGLRQELVNKQEEVARLASRLRESERNLERRSQQIAELSRAEKSSEPSIASPLVPAGSINMTIAELEEEIAGHKARHTADASKILRLEGEIANLERRLKDIEKQRPGEPAKPGTRTAGDMAVQKLESMIVDLEGQKVESQAEITRLSLQLEALRGAAGDNVEGVLASLEAENNALAEELNRLSAEHDHLKSRFDKVNAGEEQENGILRDQITDLAAEIVALTAALEGDGSVTDRILNGTSQVKASNGKAKAAPKGSLADRIRELRDQSRTAPRKPPKSAAKETAGA